MDARAVDWQSAPSFGARQSEEGDEVTLSRPLKVWF
jgi:hypothetical protein